MRKKRQWLLWGLLIMPGVTVFAICLFYAFIDWAMLRMAQAQFERVVSHPNNFNALFTAYARQDIHRTNVFADVVWALLGAIIAAIGIHALCLMSQLREKPNS